ncbi:MAG: helix-turn-helix domain-containing protein [Rhodospirillales bacterium]|nr:helix-turn-helix domain-containing protein [Rhodospirillales bacterium]
MAGKSAPGTASGVPSTRDAVLAERAVRKLAAVADEAGPVPARFGATETDPIDIPTPALRLLREILAQMAHGYGVLLTPLHAELTTRQAADLLQVSRTHLVQLLDDERIPCRKVGAHRRVRAADIVAYRRETEARRRSALDELTARDQELGLQ